jgi:nucleoside diphosphate kinase
MIEILGIKLSFEAAAFLVLFLVDEIIPYTPLKGNNIIQVLQGLVGAIKPTRKEDDVVRALKAKVQAVQDELNKL